MAFSAQNNSRMILVCGATGKTGSATVSALLRRGHHHKDDEDNSNVCVLALVRDPTTPAALELQQEGATLVTGDFNDPSSLQAAFAKGVNACFLCCANQPNQVALETSVIDAAEASETCQYLVKVGTCGAKGPDKETPDYTSLDSVVEYGRFHAAIEARLQRCDPTQLTWTCLRPNHFMQNHIGDLMATLPKVIYPHGTAKANLVDTRDVGEIAARLLVASNSAVAATHAGQCYDVCGPDGWSAQDLAALYSRVLGISAQAIACDADTYQAGLVNGAGFPPWLAKAVTAAQVNFWAKGAVHYESSAAIKELHPNFRTMEMWVKEMSPMVKR